ncbi:retrovirus-related pol polyprotein from transposon TNT 1-94 [Tanacetum coccineum]
MFQNRSVRDVGFRGDVIRNSPKGVYERMLFQEMLMELGKNIKESSDEECLTSRSEDEEYAMAVRDFNKFFKRRGRFVRQPRNNKKTFQRSRDDKNDKSDRKCFRCGDPNHLIGECPKPPKNKNQRAFVGGSWSDSGEEDDKKVNNEMYLVAQASSEVCSESSYFSNENSSIDNLVLDNEYDKLCKMSLKIITKNKRLKATRNNLEKELSVLKQKVSTLEKNKGVDLECVKCHMLKIENEKLREEVTRLNKFEKSTQRLNKMLSNQKPSGEKLSLGFNSFEASSSGTKEIKFVKAQKKASSNGGPINMGGPQSVQAAPKTIIGPPPVGTPGSEKNICLGVDLEPDEWIKDSGCSKHMTSNQKLFSSYKAYNGGNVIFGSNIRGNIIGKGKIYDKKCRVTFSEHDSEITKDGKVIGRGIRKNGLYVIDRYGYIKNHKKTVKTGKHGHEKRKSTKEARDAKPKPGKGLKLPISKVVHVGEFDNEVQFGEFCNANGITHNFSALRTPQSNGVVKRKNRTLQEMSRTMLNEQSLPQKFWCNAVDTSTYILNRILIRAILGKTPYELLKGYSQNSKAYIILNKHTRKVEESLNVTFDETPPPSKTSPLVDDDLDEEEAIKVTEKKNLENDIEDETLEIDEIVNIKESRNHLLENVIGNLNQRTLRSQAQN